MSVNSDKIFRKVFLGLMTLAVMFAFILIMHLFADVPMNSKPLWSGSLLTYVIVNLVISISGIYNKLAILFTGIIMLAIFFNYFIHWPILPSLVTGMTIMIICGLLYITFLHG